MTRNLVFLLVFLAPSLCYGASIQAPTEDIEGNPLTLDDLDFYTITCDGEQQQLQVEASLQQFTAKRGATCTATVTAIDGATSDPSNSVVIPNPPPAAPVLTD